MSQLVFIDESGDSGFKSGSSPYFVFALVIFESAEDAEITDTVIAKVADKTKNKPEFKFSATCNQYKEIFFTEIVNCPFRVKAIYVNKLLVQSTELRNDTKKFYNYFLKLLLSHSQLNNASAKLDGQKGKIRQDLVVYLRNNAKEQIAKIKTEDSKNNNLIQLADMMSGLVSRVYNNPLDKTAKYWFNMLPKNKKDVWIFK